MSKVLSWLSYMSIGLAVQCIAITQMCNIRGTVQFGGEYLILPAMIIIRAVIEDSIGE